MTKALLFAVIVGGAALGLKVIGFNVAHVTPERVRSFVVSFGAWAPLIYLLAYAQPVVPLPASVMTGLAGAAFGRGWGMLAALTGATGRACTQFLVARLLGREVVARLLKGAVATLDQKLGEQSFTAVLLIRLIPNLPFDVQNYGLGFSQVRFGPYVLATFLGMIPWTFVFVYLGESLTDPRQIWKFGMGILLVIGLMLMQWVWQARRRQASQVIR